MRARDPSRFCSTRAGARSTPVRTRRSARPGTKIFAHENTKLWLGGDFDVDWEDRHYAPRPKVALPTNTFYVSGALDFDGRTIEYKYLAARAHGRRRRGVLSRCERARRGRSRGGRPIPGRRLCDRRLDRRPRGRDEVAARLDRSVDQDRAGIWRRVRTRRARGCSSRCALRCASTRTMRTSAA